MTAIRTRPGNAERKPRRIAGRRRAVRRSLLAVPVGAAEADADEAPVVATTEGVAGGADCCTTDGAGIAGAGAGAGAGAAGSGGACTAGGCTGSAGTGGSGSGTAGGAGGCGSCAAATVGTASARRTRRHVNARRIVATPEAQRTRALDGFARAESGHNRIVGGSDRYPDLYEVLGAPRDAAPDELEAAYRARATTIEPVPQEVDDAYVVLSQERSRTLYDRLALAEAPVIAPTREPITPRETMEPPAVRDDRVVRWIAAAALLLSLVFLVAVLLAG